MLLYTKKTNISTARAPGIGLQLSFTSRVANVLTAKAGLGLFRVPRQCDIPASLIPEAAKQPSFNACIVRQRTFNQSSEPLIAVTPPGLVTWAMAITCTLLMNDHQTAFTYSMTGTVSTSKGRPEQEVDQASGL